VISWWHQELRSAARRGIPDGAPGRTGERAHETAAEQVCLFSGYCTNGVPGKPLASLETRFTEKSEPRDLTLMLAGEMARGIRTVSQGVSRSREAGNDMAKRWKLTDRFKAKVVL